MTDHGCINLSMGGCGSSREVDLIGRHACEERILCSNNTLCTIIPKRASDAMIAWRRYECP